jgi:cobalt/nickel transport system permease protein
MSKTFLQEKGANKAGLLQAIDAQLKLVSLIFLIIVLSLTHYILPILSVYLLLVILAYFSKLEIKSFLLRPLLTVGFFSILVMLPASLNIFIPGKAILKFGTVAITNHGLRFLLLFSLRSLAITSTVLLLILTTKKEELLQALKTLHLPSAFTMLISMSYRFIAILVKIIENLHLAKQSRTIKHGTTKTERQWVASRIGWTFTKAIHMSNEVTQAMISRGWQGE